jgi:hypothetical protein
MNTQILRNLSGNIPAILAISCLLLFASLSKDKPSPAATQCCTGYSIAIKKLRQFMLDSLHNIAFPGGVFSKADLITAINANPGDSVYLLTVLNNCSVQQGTDMAMTSLTATGVTFVKAKCRPCPNPNKPCCNVKACVPRINWSCIDFQNFLTADAGEVADK